MMPLQRANENTGRGGDQKINLLIQHISTLALEVWIILWCNEIYSDGDATEPKHTPL